MVDGPSSTGTPPAQDRAARVTPMSKLRQRRRRAGRRYRHPGRAEHPQAADQDRRQADHRAHHRRDAAVAGGRRDHGDDGARLPGRDPRHRARRPVRQGQPDPRGGRHPQRHHGRGAGRPRRRGVQRAAARRGAPAGLADDHRRQRRGAAGPRGGGHRDPVGRHGDRGRRRARQHRRRAAAAPAAPGPDPAVLPAVDHPRRVREGRARTRTSPPPTTARWCCATCPRCRSPSWPATSGT